MEIEGFFAYRARYTRKMPSQSRVHTQVFFKYSNGQNSNVLCRMVIEWREREHGDVEEAVRTDLMAQQVLLQIMAWTEHVFL